MTDVIVIVLVIVAAALTYIVRAKKRGVKCIGCPHGSKCGGACHGGCGEHTD